MQALQKRASGFITAQAAIIIAVIVLATCVLAYEWRGAHHSKVTDAAAKAHHHKKKHDEKTKKHEEKTDDAK
jgi:hypothetical protein